MPVPGHFRGPFFFPALPARDRAQDRERHHASHLAVSDPGGGQQSGRGRVMPQ